MKEVLRTNDPVMLSFAEALLKDAGFDTAVFDLHMSFAEGSIGILPRRLMITEDEDLEAAQRVLREADLWP